MLTYYDKRLIMQNVRRGYPRTESEGERTMKYTVANEMKPTLETKLARILAKAMKYNCKFTYTFGETYIKQVPVWTMHDGERIKTDTENVEVCDLEIDSDELIRCGKNRVLAKIEHYENANIVNGYDRESHPEWATIKPHCDHCGRNRVKTVTFMVRRETGEIKQVGRTCLKDYTGIDPQMIGFLADIESICYDADADRYYDPERVASVKLISTEEAIAFGCDVIKEQGYIKSDRPGSNKEALTIRIASRKEPTEEGEAKATEILNILKGMTQEEAIQRDLQNEWAMATNGWIKPSHLGYIAYLPIKIENYLKRLEEEKERANRHEQEKASEYVGEIGQKLEIEINEGKLVTSWETAYGYTYLYKFIGNDGNVYVWFASTVISKDGYRKLKGTVKAHNERDGVKQTVLTRCRVA